MNKIALVSIFILSLTATCFALLFNETDQIYFTTYYPAPHGYYRNMDIHGRLRMKGDIDGDGQIAWNDYRILEYCYAKRPNYGDSPECRNIYNEVPPLWVIDMDNSKDFGPSDLMRLKFMITYYRKFNIGSFSSIGPDTALTLENTAGGPALNITGTMQFNPVSAPASPQPGMMYYSDSEKTLKLYGGSTPAWQIVGGGVGTFNTSCYLINSLVSDVPCNTGYTRLMYVDAIGCWAFDPVCGDVNASNACIVTMGNSTLQVAGDIFPESNAEYSDSCRPTSCLYHAWGNYIKTNYRITMNGAVYKSVYAAPYTGACNTATAHTFAVCCK
jgi:hypothetical protein